MKIFNVCVGWNDCYYRHFRISDPEVAIEKVSIDGNDQFVAVGNGNFMIVGVEDVLQNKISGEWH